MPKLTHQKAKNHYVQNVHKNGLEMIIEFFSLSKSYQTAKGISLKFEIDRIILICLN